MITDEVQAMTETKAASPEDWAVPPASDNLKVALVTGGGSGIGRAVSEALVEDGFAVVLAGRRADRLQETAAAIGERAFPLVMDVADRRSVADGFACLARHFGRLDLLFNNAGTGVPGTILLEDVTLDDWQRTVQTNLSGSFYCTQEAFRIMKDQQPQGGRIINNGSISAHVPRPNSAPYTATKHAMTGLTRAASLDGRKYNIAVGQIDIGNAATDLTSKFTKGVPQADGTLKTEPVMDVRQVADAVRQMAALPLEANMQFVTIMATAMPFIGRG